MTVKLLPVDAARERMLALAGRCGAETLALSEADGRILVEAVTAVRDQPPFTASAMDGYALRQADAVAGARLKLIGESAAGRGFTGVVGPGEAVRIFTGAALPAGADAIVIQEDTEREGETVVLTDRLDLKDHRRPAGGDFRARTVLLAPGVRLDPWRLALAAAAGRAEVLVSRRPRVAILGTGEELAAPGGPAGPWQIYESGSVALAAMVRRWGGEPLRLAPAADDLAAILAAVEGAEADLLVTIGGASVGDYDLVKPALERLGLELAVASVNVRPGKPTWFGTYGEGRRVLGLPGNPASAFVCAELFLRPLLGLMQGGASDVGLETVQLAEALPANGPREHWMRAVLGPGGVTPFSDQDSSLVTVFASADALLRRPSDAPASSRGETVEILRLSRA